MLASELASPLRQAPGSQTVIGEPVLKKPTVAFAVCGGCSASNRKLYNVPQRIALAFWFCANVSEFQVMEFAVLGNMSRACCYSPVLNVPSLAQPGS